MEALFIGWLKEYGYIILYLWSILDGEIGLTLAGVMAHSGHMNFGLSIFVAGLGGFTGDQFFFYIGRFNKTWMRKKLHKQRRKLAIAYILLRKYGWLIIFLQRFLYGLRTIIPIAIGISNYSAKKYALINLVSAWIWAAVIMTPAYLYGQEILQFLSYAKQYWYFALPITLGLFYGINTYFQKLEAYVLQKRKNRFHP
jgi:membrane protein DedA with SNARE-associated domain